MAKQPTFYGNWSVKFTEDVRFYTATASQTTFNVNYTVGFVSVYQNGRLLRDTDYTATNGTTIVLTVAATLNDDVVCIGRVAFTIPNAITQTLGDSRYLRTAPTAALGNYASDGLAAAGGVPLYGFYRNGNAVQQRLV